MSLLLQHAELNHNMPCLHSLHTLPNPVGWKQKQTKQKKKKNNKIRYHFQTRCHLLTAAIFFTLKSLCITESFKLSLSCLELKNIEMSTNKSLFCQRILLFISDTGCWLFAKYMFKSLHYYYMIICVIVIVCTECNVDILFYIYKTYIWSFALCIPAITSIMSHLIVQMLTEAEFLWVYTNLDEEQVDTTHEVCYHLTLDDILDKEEQFVLRPNVTTTWLLVKKNICHKVLVHMCCTPDREPLFWPRLQHPCCLTKRSGFDSWHWQTFPIWSVTHQCQLLNQLYESYPQ